MTDQPSLMTRLTPWIEALGFLAGVGVIIAEEERRRRQPAEGSPPPQPRRFPGIQRPIDLLYDDRDIPHVRAFTTPDLFFGQGYATARERFWQMDLNRRIAAGSLAALFGEQVIEHDRFMRRVGLHRLAAATWGQLGSEPRAYLEAYAAGVNAYLGERDGWQVSLEHSILRAAGLVQGNWLPAPEPWSPVDSLAFANYMSWIMSVGWDSELVRARLLAVAGPTRLQEVDPTPATAKPIEVPEGVDWAAVDFDLGTFPDFAGWSGPAASNQWAVAGARSATGKPLLANDLHLVARIPSTWYEVHLLGEEINVIGATIPALPGVVVGHNGKVAWGITAGFADTQQLVVHRFSDGGLTYEAPAPPRPARRRRQTDPAEPATVPQPVEVVEERIQVLGRHDPVVERVRITRDGPILTRNAGSSLQLALRSTVLAPDSSPAPAFFRLIRAQSAQEVREVLRDWRAPCLNFAFADADDNIGWQLAGTVPKRGKGDSLLPVPGWDGAYDWQGTIPFDDLPHAFNPPDGLVWSANNAPTPAQSGQGAAAGQESDPALGFEFMDRFRAQRIADLLWETPEHSIASFRTMQADTYSIPGKALVTALARIEPGDEREAIALELLRAWDGNLTVESAGAAVVSVLKTQLLERLVLRNAGGLVPYYLGIGPSQIVLPIAAYGFRFSSFLLTTIERQLGDPARRDAALADIRGALRETVDFLRQACGQDSATWRWGDLHTLQIRHAFDALPMLGRLFNPPMVPYPGDDDTLVQSGLGPSSLLPSRRANQPEALARQIPDYLSVSGFVPTYRLIVDLGDPDSSRSVLPTGQSGRRRSKRYGDQFQAWLEHRDYPLHFSWKAVVQHTWQRVRLSPRLGT